MSKTGERYTTARRYELDLPVPTSVQPVAASLGPEEPTPLVIAPQAPALPPRVAEPGLSDEAILRGSGRTWDEWFALLDGWRATEHTHTEIARHVQEDLGTNGWYAQSVTVGYERARGLRAVNQNASGYSVNASRTVPVPIEQLFDAFLEEFAPILRVRTSRPPKSARFDFVADRTRVLVGFTERSPAKSSVALSHTGLADAQAVEAARSMWRENLSRLAARLA